MRKLKLPPVAIVILILFVVTLIPIVIGLLKQTNIGSQPKAAVETQASCLRKSGCWVAANKTCTLKATKVNNYTCIGGIRWTDPEGKIVLNPTGVIVISPTSKPAVTMSNIEIAKKVLDWLNGQKNSEGFYYLNQIVSSSQDQIPPAYDKRAGVNVLWGRLAYWKKTKDQSTYNQMISDLNLMSDLNKTPVFQPDFWACKILYEFSQELTSPGDENLRTKAWDICDRVVFGVPLLNPDQPLKVNTQLNPVTEKDVSQMISVLDVPTENISLTDEEKITYNNRLRRFPGYVSDFVAKYLWTKDQQYLTIAKLIFSSTLDSYPKLKKANLESSSQCLWGVGAVDLYKATQDKKYLTFAQQLFDRELKGTNFGQFNNLFKKAACLIFTDELNKVSPNSTYQNYRKSLLADTINNNYDDITGSFFTNYGQDFVKEIRDNAFLVRVLSE